jgi:hypothetical protein
MANVGLNVNPYMKKIDREISASIESISQFGMVVVSFGQNMRKINLQHLNQSVLDLYIQPYNNWHLYESFNISHLNFSWEPL